MTKKEFIHKIFELADEINKTSNGIDISIAVNDAYRLYDKHFNQLLSERQQSENQQQKTDAKQLNIAGVSKRLFTLKEAQEIYFTGLLTNHEIWDKKENTEEYDSEFIEMIKHNYF